MKLPESNHPADQILAVHAPPKGPAAGAFGHLWQQDKASVVRFMLVHLTYSRPLPAATQLCPSAAEVQNADQFGKGMPVAMPTHAGKGDVDVDVQCTDVCNDVCTPVPSKVCNDVPYQTQVGGVEDDPGQDGGSLYSNPDSVLRTICQGNSGTACLLWPYKGVSCGGCTARGVVQLQRARAARPWESRPHIH